MHYTYRFRLKPTAKQRELLDYQRDTCRQLYNHALTEFNEIPQSAGTLTQRVRQVRGQLTDLKDRWNELNDLYSTVAQAAIMWIENSITALGELKKKGTTSGASPGNQDHWFGKHARQRRRSTRIDRHRVY
jgi:putative transposase